MRTKKQKIEFRKMEVCGNDYIYIDCFNQTINSPESLSVYLSDRHYGIGGDGIVLICPSKVADAQMKMFNLDSLLPVYETFHDRGFDIYSVSFDVDKTAWATVVRNQKLPWTQVCDVRGDRSPLFGYYGITGLPRMALLVDGEIVSDTGITSEATLRQYLSKVLK